MKRIKLDLNSEYNKIIKVADVIKTITIDKIKWAPHDLCNDAD